MSRPTIEVLVGMIASGKSTYARARADEGALVVCHDDLAQMLHARYRYEHSLRALYRKMEEEIVRMAIQHGKDVIIDRTHLSRESRERWTSFARWPHFAEWATPAIVAVVFRVESPEVHARRRFEADPRGRAFDTWYTVAAHHYQQWAAEPIGDNEGFHRIIPMHGSRS